MDQNQNNNQQQDCKREDQQSQNGYYQQGYGNPYGHQYNNPYGNPYGNQYNPYGDYRPPIYFQSGPDSNARSCHTMGLLSVVFIFISHILSIVFGIIALNYAKKSVNALGYECPEMKSGRTMGKVGLIVGSILTGLSVLIYLITLIFILTAM